MRDEHGGWIGQVDLIYAAYPIVLEYHGDVHRSTRGKWRSDVAKTELLTRLGWRVIVLTSDDVYVRPEHTLARIQEALVTAGHPTVPADLHPAWRQHFTPRWVRDFDDQVPEVGHDGALR